ncbi:hypothetical protein ACJMK2_030279 [Sinanodonta woodiana]|uniref:Protein FAM76A n=1 Tax=Sinanodonta woodiana TaxID=1069815 RepID=A0ABD3XEL0_SINWO
MRNNVPETMSAPLFACTKCHTRHPFEELSSAEQLCKKCRNQTPVLKCTYCRAEFPLGEKGSTNSSCKRCTYNLKVYGKPTACQNCSIIAAFVGNKCDRCASYEKRYGPPSVCEQCRQKCAFERNDSSRQKVDGKLLCWLCICAYKRVLAKAKKKVEQKQDDPKKQSLTSNRQSFDKLDKLDKLETLSTGSSGRLSNHGDKSTGENSVTAVKDRQSSLTSSSLPDRSSPYSSKLSFLRDRTDENSTDSPTGHRSHGSSKSHPNHVSESDPSPAKKQRLERDNSTSNGISSTPTKSLTISSVIAMDKSPVDPNSSEHVIAITQLQEQLEILKKQLQAKDAQLLEKDKKITELKAHSYETDKDFRTKITNLQKLHSEAIESMQVKNRELLNQVKTLSKGKKKNLSPNS